MPETTGEKLETFFGGSAAGSVSGNDELNVNSHASRKSEALYHLQAVLLSLSIAFNCACFLAFNFLFPLKEKETVFVTVTKSGEEIVYLTPDKVDTRTSEIWVRDKLKEYVIRKETVDSETDNKNFAWLKDFTDPRWYKYFLDNYSPRNLASIYALFKVQSRRREVHIISANQVENGLWRIEYMTTDRKYGSPIVLDRNEWVAVIKTKISPMKTGRDTAGENPYGLIVNGYSVSEKFPLKKPEQQGAKK